MITGLALTAVPMFPEAAFGRQVRVSRGTIDRWTRAYRQGGFAALVPEPRQVAPRTPV